MAGAPNSLYTGWRDAQKNNQFATSPSAKTGNGDPCFVNGNFVNGNITGYFIETINQNTGGNSVLHYLRITLPHNSNNKITGINVEFG